MSVLRACVFPGWRFCSFGMEDERERERELASPWNSKAQEKQVIVSQLKRGSLHLLFSLFPGLSHFLSFFYVLLPLLRSFFSCLSLPHVSLSCKTDKPTQGEFRGLYINSFGWIIERPLLANNPTGPHSTMTQKMEEKQLARVSLEDDCDAESWRHGHTLCLA